MPGITIDGNDVLLVAETIGQAVRHAREGKGPSLVELKTFRWRGHSEGDKLKYRSNDLLEAWKSPEKEPIARFEKILLERGVYTQDDFNNIGEELERIVDDHVKFMEESEQTPKAEIYTDIYDVFEEGVQ